MDGLLIARHAAEVAHLEKKISNGERSVAEEILAWLGELVRRRPGGKANHLG